MADPRGQQVTLKFIVSILHPWLTVHSGELFVFTYVSFCEVSGLCHYLWDARPRVKISRFDSFDMDDG